MDDLYKILNAALEQKKALDEQIKEQKRQLMHMGQRYWYVPWVVLAFCVGSALVWAFMQG